MLCIITLLTQTDGVISLFWRMQLHSTSAYLFFLKFFFFFLNEGNSPSISQKKISLGTSKVALNLGQWIQELEHKRMMDVISIHPSISITFFHPVQVISLLQGQIQKQKNNHLQMHSHLQQIKQADVLYLWYLSLLFPVMNWWLYEHPSCGWLCHLSII